MKFQDLKGNYLAINTVINALKAQKELIFKKTLIKFFKTLMKFCDLKKNIEQLTPFNPSIAQY